MSTSRTTPRSRNKKSKAKAPGGRVSGDPTQQVRQTANALREFEQELDAALAGVQGNETRPSPPAPAAPGQGQSAAQSEAENELDLGQTGLRAICKTVIDQFDFAAAHVNSFNQMLESSLEELLSKVKPFECTSTTGIKHTIAWSNPHIGAPCYYVGGQRYELEPEDACLKNATVSFPILIDITYTKQLPALAETNEAPPPIVTKHSNFLLTMMPGMVGAVNCRSLAGPRDGVEDLRGCFILNGNQRVCPPLRTMANNRDIMMVHTKEIARYSLLLEFRSLPYAARFRSTSTLFVLLAHQSRKNPHLGKQVMIKIPYVKPAMCVGVIFMALGCPLNSIETLVHLAAGPNWSDQLTIFVTAIIRGCRSLHIETPEQALLHISKLTGRHDGGDVGHGRHTLEAEVLPHQVNGAFDFAESKLGACTPAHNGLMKCMFLALFVFRMFATSSKRAETDDRDHVAMNRLDCAGSLVTGLFRQMLGHLQKEATYRMAKQVAAGKEVKVSDLFIERKMSSRLSFCLATGTFSARKGARSARKNMTQTLSNINRKSVYSHLLRLSTTMPADGQHIKSRQVHPSQYGFQCSVESPEGQQCGLVTSICLGVRLSMGSDPYFVIRLLQTHVNELELISILDMDKAVTLWHRITRIRVNGIWCGWTTAPDKVMVFLRLARRHADIDRDITMWHDEVTHDIWVHCDRDRLLRPLFVASELPRLRNWVALFKERQPPARREQQQNTATTAAQTAPPRAKPAQVSDQLASTLDVQTLVDAGFIEYVDADEVKGLCIAFDAQDYAIRTGRGVRITHIEIDPSLMYSLGVALIPFAPHNQSPRCTYQAAMGRQACGIRMMSRVQLQKTVHELLYIQRPLVQTVAGQSNELAFQADGVNCIVAIMPYYGYNQEDSIHIKKSFIELGAFATFCSKLHEDEQKRSFSTNRERHEKPDPATCINIKHANFDKIGANGLPQRGTFMVPGDCLMGKTAPVRNMIGPQSSTARAKAAAAAAAAAAAVAAAGNLVSPAPASAATGSDGHGPGSFAPNAINVAASAAAAAALAKGKTVRHCTSIIYRGDPAIVDSVTKTVNPRGMQICKIVMKSLRYPVLADKFSSRHGQKSTVGIVIPDVDMPFTLNGMIPDILLSPLCIPSRMTMAHILEMLVGKAVCFDGNLYDATPFRAPSVTAVGEILKQNGYQLLGKERMIDGRTGQMIEVPVYIGTVYYQRLKHMVIDKAHARSTGPRQQLTRQPVEGRSRDGGQRLGEMERDVLIAYGASGMLIDRLRTASDYYRFALCKTCRFPAIYSKSNNFAWCNYCQSADGVRLVETCYAYLPLMTEELFTMGIVPKFQLKDETM